MPVQFAFPLLQATALYEAQEGSEAGAEAMMPKHGEPGTVQPHNLSPWEGRQKDQEFKATFGYVVSLTLGQAKIKTGILKQKERRKHRSFCELLHREKEAVCGALRGWEETGNW